MKRPLLALFILVDTVVVLAVVFWIVYSPGDAPQEEPGQTTGTKATNPESGISSPGTRSRSGSGTRNEPGTAADRKDPYHEIWVEGTYENNLVGGLLQPFNRRELRQLISQPEGGRDNKRIVRLIRRATAEKDASFRDLLDRADLRKEEAIALALDAYDYALDGSRNALERILAKHRANIETGTASWGSSAVWALASIEEWDLTLQALQSHSMSGDGTGGDERYAFWLTRRYHFPDHPSFPRDYQEFYRAVYGEE